MSDALVNGEPGSVISIHDRGLQFGDGVFETIAVQAGELLCLDAHFTRLEAGCRRLSIACPARDLLACEARQLCASLASAVLKLVVTRGASGRGYAPAENASANRILTVHERPDYPASWYRAGIPSYICSRRLAQQPELAGVKHLNRLEQVLLRAEVAATRYPEGVALDLYGNVIEGSMSNLFMVKNGSLSTPDLSRCGIEGVIRNAIIKDNQARGIATDIRAIKPEELYEADEVFCCNSVIGVWPLRSIGAKTFNGIDTALDIMQHLRAANAIASV